MPRGITKRYIKRFYADKSNKGEMTQENIDWLFKLKNEVPMFLDKLKGEKQSGFFHYSLTGDLYTQDKNWGLGNTVFAVKIYYTLDMLDSLPEVEREDMVNFIKSFPREDGSIFDPLVNNKASFRNKAGSIINLDFSNFLGEKTKRAEARQAFSALMLMNSTPKRPYLKIPCTSEEVEKYLRSLNWKKPWAAGAHFSTLLFFLHVNKKQFNVCENAEELIEYVIDWVNKLQSPDDGSWYVGHNVSVHEKINGAMKVITGLSAVDKLNFRYPEKLIDLCLSVDKDEHACDSVDKIYVLHYANKLTGGNYRYNEIEDFCYKQLEAYKEHYFPDIGGFSFYKHRANQYYYGAKITKGLDEPDIHGTVLFLWSIAMISQILNIDKDLGFKEFIT